MKKFDYSCYEWNRLRYRALSLFEQGIRSGDETVIQLCYGYGDKDTYILCQILARCEQIANSELKDYNPELGF